MKIGIIGAMDYEVEMLVAQAKNIKRTEKAGNIFYEGQLVDKEVVVVVCGIGKVNAAQCSQQLISEFAVTHIINSGVAGAIKDNLDVLDVVISTDLMHHDYDLTKIGDFDYGQMARMETSSFSADKTLCDLAYKASKAEVKDHNVFCDRIVSGDQFVADFARKEFILKQFDAAATEMEGAAIAQVCYLNQIPFVVIRAISDKADGSADVSYESFSRQAAEHSSKIVVDILRGL